MKKLLNNAVAVIVVMIVLLLIIPLNPFVLDVFIILNISISLIILLISMNIKEPLEFSIFPSMLLITTLFRIGINISSTRNILGNSGTAGAVIKAMGDFVLQGNVVVGFIIFIIIVLVQFLVITKGAERVAEVAARFTLDAMPGKQMAIDADLSTGLIDEQQAKERRYKIQKEDRKGRCGHVPDHYRSQFLRRYDHRNGAGGNVIFRSPFGVFDRNGRRWSCISDPCASDLHGNRYGRDQIRFGGKSE